MNNENELNELNPPVLDGYTKIPTFKLWVANRFPYMETDFDALSNYELMEVLTNYLNNVIKNEENVESNVAKLNQAYLELLTYVKDYFNNLDVQEEINNKLDDLVADGTLTNLISTYVQPLIDEQNQEINAFKTQVNAKIDSQDSKIEAAQSGSPLVASSTAGMTDTTRVYVNTTDGNWYYYNGTQWVAGGQYLTSNLSATSLKGLFKRKINQNLVEIDSGALNNQGNIYTLTNACFNKLFFRPTMVIKNNNVGSTLKIHKYTINEDNTIHHINGDIDEITDNDYHYINYNNAYATRFNLIMPDDFADDEARREAFANIEIYINDDYPIVPEELVRGGIWNSKNANYGTRYSQEGSYNWSHFTYYKKMDKDTIVKLKYLDNINYEDYIIGCNVYVYNEDKYLVGDKVGIYNDLNIFVKKGNYIALVFASTENKAVDYLALNEKIKLEFIEADTLKENYYKVPLFTQYKLFLSDTPNDLEEDRRYDLQSMTSNNDYLFTAGRNKFTDNDCQINKISIADPTNITRFNHLELGHANGITYNDIASTLAVVEVSDYVKILNPDTMATTSSVDLKTKLANIGIDIYDTSGISYNSKYNKYCVFGKYPNVNTNNANGRFYFIILDENLDFVKKIEFINHAKVTYGVSQDISMTDNLIMLCVYNGNNKSKILYYDWNGNMVSNLNCDMGHELEGFTILNEDDYYLGFNRDYITYDIYKMKVNAYRVIFPDEVINDFETMLDSLEKLNETPTGVYNTLDDDVNGANQANFMLN